MKKGLRFLSVFLVIALLLVNLTACTSNQTKKSDDTNALSNSTKTEKITIVGLNDGNKEISIDELKKMEFVSKEMKSIDSKGEVATNKVKGVSLEKILNQFGESKKDYTGIRFIAGDGYSIVVPKEILEIRDVVLSYEIDEKPLDEMSQPIRVAIPNERSMYWVKNLMKIELLQKKKTNIVNKVIFLDTAVMNINQEDYDYYDKKDKAVKTEDLVKEYSTKEDAEGVFFKAVDGFEKEENLNVFKSAYIKITGENSPLFLSPDLPLGMQVKNIETILHGDTVYFSLKQGFRACELKTVKEHEGISLKDIFSETKLIEAEKYVCKASDGYESEITKEDIDKGIIYERNKGGYTLMFKDMPKNTKVKQILSIEPVK